MSRIVFTSLFVFYALLSFGQNSPAMAAIQPPADSSRLILHVYATGVQMYACAPNPKDTTQYLWTFTGPSADLYADSAYHQLIGKHYAGADKNPVWENKDGSTVSGVKVHAADSPDGNAIPWLLLKRISTKSKGVLTSVVYIQRVNTKGGKAPAMAGKASNGQTVKVAYTAEYLFYGAK